MGQAGIKIKRFYYFIYTATLQLLHNSTDTQCLWSIGIMRHAEGYV